MGKAQSLGEYNKLELTRLALDALYSYIVEHRTTDPLAAEAIKKAKFALKGTGYSLGDPVE